MKVVSIEFQDLILGSNIKYKMIDVFLKLSLMSLLEIGDFRAHIKISSLFLLSGLPRWISDKEFACQHRRHRSCVFNPWVGKMPWRRKWQLTPVSLFVKSHVQRSLKGCTLGVTKSWTWLSTHVLKHFFFFFTHLSIQGTSLCLC